MDKETAKKAIVEKLQQKKGKTMFYLKDFYPMVPDEKPRVVNNIVNEMVREGILEYWSSGSTTLIGLKGMGQQAAGKDKD
ncbi:MAG: dissimilatory sulfite reductase D family protein [Desulfobacterales bacterium]|nr:dissimilatory sulfite reductase D family protein [Desulfobacterales bacterium]